MTGHVADTNRHHDVAPAPPARRCLQHQMRPGGIRNEPDAASQQPGDEIRQPQPGMPAAGSHRCHLRFRAVVSARQEPKRRERRVCWPRRVVTEQPRAAHKHRPGDEVWLVGECRSSGATKYYLSNLPPDTPLRALASWIKARWVCEQGHQQMKEELGLDHFEGRSWPGLHHHALLVMIALAFLQHLRLAAAPERGKKAKAQLRTAAATDAARRAPSHSRAYSSDGTNPMSVLSVLARPVQAGVELPK